jgi:hypothetical protein
MNGKQRPLAVTILGWLYIGVGAIGFAYHFSELRPRDAFQYDGVWIELIRVLAIVVGAFMLLGQDWARWLALAWMALHVVLSAFHTIAELLMHCLFFAVIAWFLFRPEVRRYFASARTKPI